MSGPETATERPTVMVVDNEVQARTLVSTYLQRDGFDVVTAYDGVVALGTFEFAQPDLVVLDLTAPQVEEVGLLSYMTAEGFATPVILLGSDDNVSSRIDGLELGAEDVMGKPVSPREVAVRVRRILGRQPQNNGRLSFGSTVVEPRSRTVTRDGSRVELRPREFDLLVELVSHPKEVLSREELLHRVWGSNSEWQDPGTVTVHIRRLRKLLEKNPALPDHITTVYGVGYRFDL